MAQQDKYLNERQTTRLWAKIKAYVTNAIGGITSVSFVIVQTLPAAGVAGAIYLVPNSGSSPNIYDEYIYVANAWEKIGTTEIDLSGYVQTSRKVNNKALSADITLSAADVGAQAKITASGLLKGDGSGNITAAVAGTDYIASHQDISGKLDKSGGTMTGALTLAGDPVSDLQAATKKYVDDNAGSGGTAKIWTGYCTTSADVVPKVVTLDDPTGFTLEAGNMIVVEFVYGMELSSGTTPTMNVNGTGAKGLYVPSERNGFSRNVISKFACATHGMCLFSYQPGLSDGGWVLETSGLLLSKTYSLADAALPKAGGTMTGALTLSGAPTANLHAATKKYVDEAIGSVTGLSFEIVQSLPQTGDAGTIYLVPNSGSSPNIYDEYIYVANAWEKIGTTEIDLSGYVQTSRKVNNKALSADITLTASDVGALPSTTSIPSKTSDLTNDSGFITGYTETDPTVPSWAKESSKPSYTAAEVGAQAKITASGLLKGDGSGNITAAVAGTDYIASHQDISGKLDKSGGTMTGALTLSGAPTNNLHAATKKYVDDILDTLPIIPTASTTNPSMDGTASYGSGTSYARSNHVHPTDTSRQAKITASGLLKGDGSGGVSAATAGTDYLTLATLPIYDGTVV